MRKKYSVNIVAEYERRSWKHGLMYPWYTVKHLLVSLSVQNESEQRTQKIMFWELAVETSILQNVYMWEEKSWQIFGNLYVSLGFVLLEQVEVSASTVWVELVG